MILSRRSFNRACVAAATSGLIRSSVQAGPSTRSSVEGAWLLFMKSADFEHDVVKDRPDGPNLLERQLGPIFEARGLKLVTTKDGAHFEPDRIRRYAGFVFYTTGDLTQRGKDGHPPMSLAGKAALLSAVRDGTPFLGLHCASDTFGNDNGDESGPYCRMLGGAFDAHGAQQRATARIVDPTFPGIGRQDDWTFDEEWYALTRLADDLHPIHVLETAGMHGEMYRRPPYPITWTRQHGEGRVFYTAIGHREDVIASQPWQTLVGGAIDWCRGR